MKFKTIILLIMSMGVLLMIGGCGGNKTEATNATGNTTNSVQSSASHESLKGKKVLIAYYSWSGHTKQVAEQIQKEIGGDLFEIKTVQPYPNEHGAASDVAKKELDANARPELSTKVANMADYDVIVLGYPIWWYTSPMAVNTFLESYDLKGKVIVPFCTSGGYGVEKSVADIRKVVGDVEVRDGLLANDQSTIDPWLKKSGLL